MGNLPNRVPFRALTDPLAAGHGYRVVVQNFVGDVDPGSNRLANRQQSAMKVSAIAQIGKNMRVGGERLLADPGHALTAHLRETHG